MTRVELRIHKALAGLCGFVLLYLSSVVVGPALEPRIAPARVEQAVDVVERTGDRLCWNWRSHKVRPLASDDLDVTLVVNGDRMVSSIFSAASGMPWRRMGAVSLGPHVQRYCLTLPPHVTGADELRVEQTVFYPGWLGLYRFPSRIPDVISPGS